MPRRDDYRTTNIPNKPGVYVFRDSLSSVIYVGKAKSLRKRLSSYFQPSRQRTADPKLRSLINSISEYDIHVLRNENEALLLESKLVKQYSPRYNVLLRDDKRFLLIKIDIQAPYPKLNLARLKKDDGALYFGPFPQAAAIRETIDFLNRTFGLRSCNSRIPDDEDKKHCMNDIVRYCSAPCTMKVDQDEYREKVDDLINVLNGQTKEVIETASERMQRFADKKQFEQAARMRDVIENLKSTFSPANRRFTREQSLRTYPGPGAVDDLKRFLSLKIRPSRMECFDISNIMGTFSVASMVSFEDGEPDKKNYRHFRIKTVEGINDFAMMKEAVLRRYSRLKDEARSMPDLIVIDGGLGQLHSAYDALMELKLTSIPIIGLAKKQEEVFTIESNESIRIDHSEPALRLLQCIRDEAHRFAITFHKELRKKRILNSLLDEIPGVGKKRKEDILKAFGSVKTLRKYDASELKKRIPGIGEKLAEDIMTYVSRN
jgi:excinuclease ABC subunit C